VTANLAGRRNAPLSHPGGVPVRPGRHPCTSLSAGTPGCYSLSEDQLWGVTRLRKGGDHTLAALQSIRAARPYGAPIYVICDNLSPNKTPAHPRLGQEEQGAAVLHADERLVGQPDPR
jgi:hypothetical protein